MHGAISLEPAQHFKLLLSRRRVRRPSGAAPARNLPAAEAAPDVSVPISTSRGKKSADAMSDVSAEEDNEGMQDEQMPSSAAAAAQVGCPDSSMMA